MCVDSSARNARRTNMSGTQEWRCLGDFLREWSREVVDEPPPAKTDDPSLAVVAKTYGPQPSYRHRSPGKVHPGRLSETTSAVSMDGITKQIRVMVPPFLAGTPAGFELAMRLLHGTWQFQLKCDIGDAWSRPTPPATVKLIERRLGKGKQLVRKCVVCQTATRSKCNACFDVYYCCQACQQKHSPQHRPQCKAPAVAIDEHLSIAVPDYMCFWQHQHAISVPEPGAICRPVRGHSSFPFNTSPRVDWQAIIVHSQDICRFL